jgi:lipopolysaccharide transport system permease protein
LIQAVREISENFHALRIQFFVTLKTSVATTRLGVLWWVLDPLFLMLLYTFVVKIIFDRGGPNYHLFALCGIVTFQAFSRSVTLCSSALTRNAQLIKQTSFPMHLYVLLPPLVQSFFYLIGLTIVAVWNYSVVGWHTLAVVLLLVPMILIPYSLGLFFAIITVRIPDFDKFIPYIVRFGFYISPVLYPAERVYELPNVNPIFKSLYALNPMVYVIGAARDLLLSGEMFNVIAMAMVLAITLLFIQFGLLFFRSQARFIPRML